MDLPQYVTVEEVQRVCRELNISDWTAAREPKVPAEEAAVILDQIDTKGLEIDLEDFTAGLEVELEHGTQYAEANVTNNHPLLTGMIVLAHLKESLDYYKRLEIAEIEGDLVEAIVAGDAARTERLYGKLANARLALDEAVAARLSAG
jgi:hypothetical protein